MADTKVSTAGDEDKMAGVKRRPSTMKEACTGPAVGGDHSHVLHLGAKTESSSDNLPEPEREHPYKQAEEVGPGYRVQDIDGCGHGRCVNKDEGSTCSPGGTGQNCKQATGGFAVKAQPSGFVAQGLRDDVYGNKTYTASTRQESSIEQDGMNVALGKTAFQTSSRPDGAASLAVDGNTDTHYHHGSCTHTKGFPGEANPSWWVDLGQSYVIDRVVIFNRQDCCSKRLNPFNIHIGDSDQVSANPKCGGNHQMNLNQPSISVSCQGMKGRYVGVRLPGPYRILTLCEVQVFSDERHFDGCNACSWGWLTRHSSWVVGSTGTPWVKNGVTYDAAKALDGDIGTYWNPQGTDENHNWYIAFDLTVPQTLTRIAVNNYGDTTHDIAAFTLQKSQVGSPYNWEDVLTVTNVQRGTYRRQEFGGFRGTARYWRFLITRTHSGYQPYLTELNLFRISSDINECTRKPCLHGHCVNKDGGYKCTCSPGWTGQNCQQDTDECTRKPCLHGHCVNKDGGYKCICLPGWTGQNCQQGENPSCKRLDIIL
ncbi:uncharacterized protein LOC118420023 [Branchiostoma floridae]|uniref:Uncharacterized protein LOC118420023 n=1 Tax=Branchiostoma floridae TaxID=7739 RepID=A0A9J7LIY5_BRAFL|nr:uncharacterized protein LOC118420023 [Branchiostoma floridae]